MLPPLARLLLECSLFLYINNSKEKAEAYQKTMRIPLLLESLLNLLSLKSCICYARNEFKVLLRTFNSSLDFKTMLL